MTEFFTLIKQFIYQLQFWIIVSPWEQCLRVRSGKWVTQLEAGTHLKLPIIDTIYIQSVRTRVTSLGRQTIGVGEHTYSLCGQVQYCIKNIRDLYNTLHHAEDAIASFARQAIADSLLENLTHPNIQKKVELEASISLQNDLHKSGIREVSIAIVEMSRTKTYRFIGDGGVWEFGSQLNTEKAHGA